MEKMSCIYKTEERYNKRNAYILEIKNKKEEEREKRRKKAKLSYHLFLLIGYETRYLVLLLLDANEHATHIPTILFLIWFLSW